MNSQKLLGTYFITLAVYLSLDFLWLGVIARDFYQNQLGGFIDGLNWFVVFCFYLIYTLGLVYFVVFPNLDKNPFISAFKGGFLGLIAYSAYNLTNLATIKSWPATAAAADTMWGFLLSFFVTLVTIAVVQKLGKK